MLGLGQSLSHGGAPSAPIKLDAPASIVLQGRPDDENVFLFVGILNTNIASLFSASSGTSLGQILDTPVQLKVQLTFERITGASTVAATGVGTYNVFISTSGSNVFVSEATSDSDAASFLNNNGSSLIDLTNTSGAIDVDPTSADQTQKFRVTVIFKADGFLDSDGLTSAIVDIAPKS